MQCASIYSDKPRHTRTEPRPLCFLVVAQRDISGRGVHNRLFFVPLSGKGHCMNSLKTVGFPISHKENEFRRALIPSDVCRIAHPDCIYIEQGYGTVLGYTDDDYASQGVHIGSRSDILNCAIICDPKVGDAEYLCELHGQTVFGWMHAVQNREITDTLVRNRLTAYAWEDMFEQGRHCFWRNNEIAGEAAISHAYLCHGIFPYNTKVAVLGRGNTARGAIKTLNYMGAEVVTYDRRTESLFRKELPQFDVVVNAILWDTSRHDHIICRSDLQRMKSGSMIIDISCDRAGGIETSHPTTIDSPTYFVDGVRHYVVDHTPSLFYKTTTIGLSEVVSAHLTSLIEAQPDPVLCASEITRNGEILDKRIKDFQNR